METEEEKLGMALASLRKQAGLSQDFLAQELRHDQTFVSKIENGRRQLNLQDFSKWCQVLSLDDETILHLVKLSDTSKK